MIAAVALCLLPLAGTQDEPSWTAAERVEIDGALSRAAAWLLARQGNDGGWRAEGEPPPSPVLATAAALQALVEVGDAALEERRVLGGCAFLFRHRREDGGIHTAGGGLALYESEAARAALEAVQRRFPSEQIPVLLEPLVAFAEARWAAEEVAEESGARRAEELLSRGGWTDGQRRALEFLRRRDDAEAGWTSEAARDAERERRRSARPPFVFALGRASPEWREDAAWVLGSEGPAALCRLLGERRYVSAPLDRAFIALVAARLWTLDAGERSEEDRLALRARSRALARELLDRQTADGSWPRESEAAWPTATVLTTAYAALALRTLRDGGH